MATKVYRSHGAPASTTFGNVGELYVDLDTNELYKCIDITTRGDDHGYITIYQGEGVNTEYTWAKAGGDAEGMLKGVIEGTASEVSSDALAIRASVFQGCTNLTKADFPVCTSIGSSAFQGCTNLTKANFPACTSIGGSVFYGCSGLTEVNFPVLSSFPYLTGFGSASNLVSVNFPALTSLPNYAFIETSLSEVTFPACTSIGNGAFMNCSCLTKANFPVCASIGNFVFQGCTNLSTLVLGGSKFCSIKTSNVLSSTNIDNGWIYVRSSLVSRYQAADYWSFFSSRFSAIESMT